MLTIEIILPHYNGSKYIADQLKSIQCCEVPPSCNLKLLVIDDCSALPEYEHLSTICKDHPEITVIRNNVNLGVVRSIEHGLSISTGDYVMLCDQDDHWLPEKIKISLEKIREVESNQPALVFTDLQISDDALNVVHPSMFSLFNYRPQNLKNSILLQNMVTGCTIIMNRKLLSITLPFPPDVLIHDHWLAICATYSGVIEGINSPTILYRQHSNNLIGARAVSFWRKLMNLKATLLIKHNSHILRSIQTSNLALRLKERGLTKNTDFLEKASRALESNSFSDVFFLKDSKVINFNCPKNFFITGFLILVSSYKMLRKQVVKTENSKLRF